LKKKQPKPSIIEIPKPGKNHVVCSVCRKQFRDYYEHVQSIKHVQSLKNYQFIYNEIDSICSDLMAKNPFSKENQLKRRKRIIVEENEIQEREEKDNMCPQCVGNRVVLENPPETGSSSSKGGEFSETCSEEVVKETSKPKDDSLEEGEIKHLS
jgi:hypothetical protein